MKKPRRKGRKQKVLRPSPQDHAPVDYLTVRDGFIATHRDDNAVEWMVEVGRFVLDRWLAEERLRKEGEPFNEQEGWPEWDKCTQKQLVELKADARLQLEEYVARQRAEHVRDFIYLCIEKVPGTAGRFIGKGILNALISTATLIIVGALFLWLGPEFIKMARGRVDLLLPASTVPDNRVPLGICNPPLVVDANGACTAQQSKRGTN